jgi:hypothetical protein
MDDADRGKLIREIIDTDSYRDCMKKYKINMKMILNTLSKKTIVILNALLISFTVFTVSCSSPAEEVKNFNSFYDKNKSQPHFTTFSVPVSLLKMAVIGNDQVKEILNHVNEVRFISYEGKADSTTLFINELKTSTKDYRELMDLKNSVANGNVKVREDGDRVKELLILSVESGSFFAVCIEGDLDLANVKSLVEAIDISKLKDLAKGSIF